MPKYIKIERSDISGSYISPPAEIQNVIDGELDDLEDMPPGTKITLTVVTMSRKQYEELPEFSGW